MASVGQMRINCLIDGDDPYSHQFTVNVDRRFTVPALKEIIRLAKPQFKDEELELFKACVPRRMIEETTSGLHKLLCLKRENLIPFEKYDSMDTLFSKASPGDFLHVLIRKVEPVLQIKYCSIEDIYASNEISGVPSLVSVKRGGNIGDLREEIAKHLGADPLDLQIFKIHYDTDSKEFSLSDELLPGVALLDQFFVLDSNYREANVAFANLQSSTSTYTSANPFLPLGKVPAHLTFQKDSSSHTRKRMRVVNPKTELGYYTEFYEMYWGVDFKEKTLQIPLSGLERSTDDRGMVANTVVPYIDLPNGRSFNKLMVRTEYEFFYKRLVEDQGDGLKGAVVCGHPGIGKSLFLYYCLIRRLSAGLETVFSEDAHRVVFHFSSKGMRRLSPIVLPDEVFADGTWALIDADATPTPPPAELVHKHRAQHFYAVLAASPQQSRYKEFSKQSVAPRYWMKPWAWDEIWAASRFNAVTDMNPSKLRDIFDKYGGSARVVYASCIGTIERQFENGVKEAIQGMDLDHLRSFLSKSVEDTWIDSVSSKLFVVRPSASPPEHTSAQYDVASDYILKLLMERFATTFNAFQTIIIQILKGVDRAAAVRGMVFEVSCHGKLMNDTGTLSLTEMVSIENPTNTKFTVIPNTRTKELRLQERKPVYFGNDVSELPSVSIDGADYYIPKAANNATFDSFLVWDQQLYVFQITVGREHDAKKKGLDTLKQIMKDKAIKAWNFVCVVPELQTVELLIPNVDVTQFKKHFKFYHLQLPL